MYLGEPHNSAVQILYSLYSHQKVAQAIHD